ncbi:hypothetical protein PSHT_01992 [Puccinia striiformis]|uniref:Uncharacterized protein n=1 Tax=Puccinia striiformis TaxID=27350 RepID=A0A2S4WJ50_9BASI|nr:hypothetical protein PSHT_01992 [Puccinia striiformis]
MYAFQNLHDWVAKLFSRPHIEKLFEQTTTCSRLPYNPNNKVKDIHDSKVWKQFLGPNGKQHTACSFNLTFGLYTDAINPYRNQQASKHTSIRFLILICLTLPNESRFLPEISCEPSLKQINWILRPLIQQLKTLWEPVFHLSKTHQHAHGQQLCGALLTFLGDLPAFAPADYTCPSNLACNSRDATSASAREDIFNEHGVRYLALLEPKYWDSVSFHVVDLMHNLLLGLLK